MDNVHSTFHTLVTDGSTEQILLLVECSSDGLPYFNYYLSSDGDMTVDGATFTDELTSGDNYGLGCIPSRTMSVALMNLDGHLNGHSYGWLHAYIGALFTHSELTFGSGVNVALDYVGEDQDWSGLYECKTTGFYKDNTLIDGSGNCTGAFTAGDGDFYYFIIENDAPVCYVYNATDGTVKAVSDTPQGAYITDMFISKFADGHFVDIEPGSRFYVDVHHEYSDSYRLCSMGHFRVDKPNKTMGQTVNISDAFDPIHEMDVDASSILASTNAADGYALLTALVSGCGMSLYLTEGCIQDRLQSIPVTPSELAKNSYTCRKLASYLLEAVGCNGRLYTGTNKFYAYTPYSQTATKDYPIGATRIAAGSLEIQEYVSHAVDRVSVKSLDGDTTMYPSVGDYCYTYDGNPFTSKANNTLFGYVRQIPQYQPMTFSLLEADPSFQVGDLITVEVSYGDEVEIADYFGRTITDYALDIITITPSEGKWVIPLMAQRITWNGKTSAEYEAKGSEDRSGYVSGGDYTDVNARTAKITNVSELNNDAGYLTLATLPIYGADVQIVYDGEVS